MTIKFEPEDKDMVMAEDCDNPNGEQTMLFVVRRATEQDKSAFVVRMKAMLPENEEIDEESLKVFFDNKNIFLCIENEEICLIDGMFFTKLVYRKGVVEALEETTNHITSETGLI
jgi:hypothetical protein